MTILEMLKRLAEKAPDMCRLTSKAHYIIGEYTFYQHSQYGFMATKAETPGHMFTGRPALAWLADAMMGECERRGWYWDIISYGDEYSSNISNITAIRKTVTEALLAAFLAVVEGER